MGRADRAPTDAVGPAGVGTPMAGLILAAGAGHRFSAGGGAVPKLLSEVRGRPLIAHAIDGARRSGLDPLFVVLPPESDALHAAAQAADARVRTVINPVAASGIGSSVVAGLAALDRLRGGELPAACVVLLADQPGIDIAVVDAVVAAWRRTGRPVRARYDDGPGHPVVLPRSDWSRISADLRHAGLATGADEGARNVLAGLDVLEVPVPGTAPVDVDVPEDLPRATSAQDPQT